jgi:hypothetical protein
MVLYCAQKLRDDSRKVDQAARTDFHTIKVGFLLRCNLLDCAFDRARSRFPGVSLGCPVRARGLPASLPLLEQRRW